MGQRGRVFGLGGAGLNFGFGGAASNSTDHRPTYNNENTMSNGRANNDEGTGTGLMAFGRGRGALRGHGGRGGLRNGDDASANEPEQPRQNFGSAATSAERGRGGRAMLHIHGHGRGCGLPFERGGLQSGASISAPKDHGPRGNLDHADDEPPTIGLATASGRGRGRVTRGPPGAFGTFGRGGAQIGSNAAGSGNQQKQHGDNNQSDNNNNRDNHSDDNNQQEPPEFDRRRIPESRCYMPPEKTSLELFDENVHIQKGPLFDDQFGPWHDNEIIVTCNGRVIEQSHRHTGTFRAFGLSQEIMNSVHIRKYVTPTQIQRAVIPLIMGHGEDIMGNAQTGSGKTAAFLLPIVNNLQTIVRQETSDNNLLRRIRAINRNAPKCIILVPAKELAEQIYEEARIFAEKTNVSVARSYGDMPMYRSRQSIENGCDILVLTSGRLKHHLRDRHINLANLRYFVLDEADKLIEENHFYDAVELTIEEATLTQNSPRHDPHAVCCRVMLFSATFNHHVQELAQAMLRDGYFFVRIGEMNRAVEIINQTFIEVEPSRKQEQLLDILCAGAVELPSQDGRVPYLLPVKKTIVFVEQKAFAALLTATLASRGFRVAHITSDCSLLRRLKVREHFLRGTVQLVVATNLLARGMNFPNVEHVINYDLPNYEPEAFIHRVGRTGRAGNLGRATSFFDTRSERDRANAAYYAKVLRTAKQPVPGFLLLCAGQAFDDLPEDVQGTSDGLQSGWNQSDDNWAHRNRNMGNAASSSRRPPTTVDNGGVCGNNMSSSTPDGIDNTIGQEKVVIRDTTEFEVVLSSEEHNGLTDTETAAPGDDHIGLTDEEDAENEENFLAPDAVDCDSRFEEIREEFFGNTGPPQQSQPNVIRIGWMGRPVAPLFCEQQPEPQQEVKGRRRSTEKMHED